MMAYGEKLYAAHEECIPLATQKKNQKTRIVAFIWKDINDLITKI